MNFSSVSGAAAVALAGSLLFAVLAYCWLAISDKRNDAPVFSGALMNEAAQGIRDRWVRSGRQQSTYLAAGLVFALFFASASLPQQEPLLRGAPLWQSVVLLAVVAIAVAFAIYRFAKLLATRYRLRLRRDASLIAGNALQKLNAHLNRVFHDVPCSAGTIDHVVVGLHGIYAIHVVARRPGKNRQARLRGEELQFAARHEAVSIAPFIAVARRLARECSKAVHHEIHVRCVVTVPGWEISEQSGDDVLLVNERNVSMLSGWRDQRDYLLNEDVTALHALLGERCTRRSINY